MPHSTPLLATIVGGIVLAFVLGTIAHRLRLSPLVGYLLAGIAVGPFTPGFTADAAIAGQLAEIGVILLMFGVGLHFSPRDLLSVQAIAVPGALGQILLATLLGMGLAWAMGWSWSAGLVFGLALSVASTVVLLRALQDRRMLETERGRIAVGWLIVEDLAMVMALLLIPVVADAVNGADDAAGFDFDRLLSLIVLTFGKIAAFVVLVFVVGRRIVPAVLHYIARTGSRELFRLAVLAIALGMAFGAAALFDVSFALGAFFAGMILSESELSNQAAQESLPLRDAFAVLFFVSVGMLFDPTILITRTWPVLATVLIILVGKSLAAFAIVIAFRYPAKTALTISASLAQIGEFSFILATLGVDLGLLPGDGRDLILAGALLSILVNPLYFFLIDHLRPWVDRRMRQEEPLPEPEVEDEEIPVTELTNHAVVIGYGRVGSLVADGLRNEGKPVLVIEDRGDLAERIKGQGFEVIAGNAAQPSVLAAANLGAASWLLVAIPNAFEAGQIIEQARAANPGLEIAGRAHSDAEMDYLTQRGVSHVIMGEQEIARGMLRYVLETPGRRAGAEGAPA